MKYNFDEIIERRGTNSYKWDLVKEDGVIPMWVADMDFQTAPCIIEALQKRVAHGIFGYTLVPDSYYEAIISWFSRRHQWKIEKDWILYTSGVVPAISCCLKAICMPGEKVLVQTPVYNCFFSCITNSGCEVVENELKRVGNRRLRAQMCRREDHSLHPLQSSQSSRKSVEERGTGANERHLSQTWGKSHRR